jgi:hypothetical protein
MKLVRLSALSTGHLYPQEIFLTLISVRSWVDPMAIVRPEGLSQWKIPVKSSGLEPVNIRLLAFRTRTFAFYKRTKEETTAVGPMLLEDALTQLKLCLWLLVLTFRNSTSVPVLCQIQWPHVTHDCKRAIETVCIFGEQMQITLKAPLLSVQLYNFVIFNAVLRRQIFS